MFDVEKEKLPAHAFNGSQYNYAIFAGKTLVNKCVKFTTEHCRWCTRKKRW